MGQFEAGNKKSAGRPRGSKNIKSALPKKLTDTALIELQKKIDDGDFQAIQWVLNRNYAPLKAVTPIGSIDAKMLEIKVQEHTELLERITALEAIGNE